MNNGRKQILQYLRSERDDAVWQVSYATSRKTQINNNPSILPHEKVRIIKMWQGILKHNEDLSEAYTEAIDLLQKEWAQ